MTITRLGEELAATAPQETRSAENEDARPWMKVAKFARATSEETMRHLPLVRHMIKARDYGDALSYDEKVGAGMIGVAAAIERYEEGRRAKLGTWIAYLVDKSIRNETRAERNRRKRCFPHSEFIADAPDARATEANELAEREEQTLMLELMREALETLDPRSKRVIEGVFLEGKSEAEVGKEFGVSQSWTSRIAKSALRRLKREIERRRAARANAT